jgi:membrane-bound lytic murein transglycosylase B
MTNYQIWYIIIILAAYVDIFMNKIKSKILSFSMFILLVLFLLKTALQAQERVYEENPMPFDQWVSELKVEALAKGIDENLFDIALQGVTPNAKVIELDRSQPEFTQTFDEYISRRVSATRIDKGREMMVKYGDELAQVSAHYGVQAQFIASIWGMETNYGGYTGGYNVIRSLATLAYDPRRSRFFRTQLFSALRIANEGHVPIDELKGSWGGAMGQSQFMPSNFFVYAQDFDGDGRRDIWGTPIDVFASIANYLKKHGWQDNLTWGRQIVLPENFANYENDILRQDGAKGCRAERSHSRKILLAGWQNMGLKRLNGDDLPKVEVTAALVRPAGATGPAYLTYHNFGRILNYNCANYYALAVGQLADQLR